MTISNRPDGDSTQWIGWTLWGLLFVGIAISVGLHPLTHTVTPEYRRAAEYWLQSKDIYVLGTIHGFLYFPSGALFYIPFTFVPLVPGEIVWRLICIGSLALAVWRLTRLIFRYKAERLFWLVTLLTIPACFSSARNGQTNMPLSALMILASVDLAGGNWTRSAVSLGLCFILKPIAVVMIGLVFCLYSPMRRRLVIVVATVAILPWLRSDWNYVWTQHVLFVEKMALAANPQVALYNDLRGLLLQVGIDNSDLLLFIVRFVIGLGVLFLAWKSEREVEDKSRSCFYLGALNACYLMICNPRTETNSYVILAPFIAVLAVRRKMLEGRQIAGLFLIFLVLTLGSDSYGSWIFYSTNLWLKVLAAITFLAILAWEIIYGKSWPVLPPTLGGVAR